MGTTDSEHAFCWLLSKIEQAFSHSPQSTQQLRTLLGELCDQLADLGVFNVLISDSKHLYAYCTTKMSWISRRAPFGAATLVDKDLSVDFGQETTPSDVVTVVATSPLTDNEKWNPVVKNQLFTFLQGECLTVT